MRCILKAGINIGLFQVRKTLKDFLRIHPPSEHLQYLAGGNPHAANRWPAAADIRYDRDPIEVHETLFIRTPG
jgi:hypothetical protein